MIPQLIIIVLGFISLTTHAYKHGEDSDVKYNVFHKILIMAISWTILYYGGFWSVILNV